MKPGQPDPKSKLNDEIEEKICELIAAGHSYESAAIQCGILDWRTKGQQDPESRYGQLARAVEQANERAKAMFVGYMATNSDWRARWKLMKNKWPQEFSERISLEHSGPDGGAIEVKGEMQHKIEFSCDDEQGFRDLFPIIEAATGRPIEQKEIAAHYNVNGENGNGNGSAARDHSTP